MKILKKGIALNNNTVATTTSNDRNAEVNKQKSKLKSGLVVTSLYANSISSSLYLLKDNII